MSEGDKMLKNNYFRAWDEKEKIMLDGDFIEENSTYTAGMSYGKLFIANQSDGEWYECIVMQWTGIYDKSGKQIFEGDILEIWYPGSGRPHAKKIEQVVYRNDSACFVTPNVDDFNRANIKVIGNIFETPELLEDDIYK